MASQFADHDSLFGDTDDAIVINSSPTSSESGGQASEAGQHRSSESPTHEESTEFDDSHPEVDGVDHGDVDAGDEAATHEDADSEEGDAEKEDGEAEEDEADQEDGEAEEDEADQDGSNSERDEAEQEASSPENDSATERPTHATKGVNVLFANRIVPADFPPDSDPEAQQEYMRNLPSEPTDPSPEPESPPPGGNRRRTRSMTAASASPAPAPRDRGTLILEPLTTGANPLDLSAIDHTNVNALLQHIIRQVDSVQREQVEIRQAVQVNQESIQQILNSNLFQASGQGASATGTGERQSPGRANARKRSRDDGSEDSASKKQKTSDEPEHAEVDDDQSDVSAPARPQVADKHPPGHKPSAESKKKTKPGNSVSPKTKAKQNPGLAIKKKVVKHCDAGNCNKDSYGRVACSHRGCSSKAHRPCLDRLGVKKNKPWNCGKSHDDVSDEDESSEPSERETSKPNARKNSAQKKTPAVEEDDNDKEGTPSQKSSLEEGEIREEE